MQTEALNNYQRGVAYWNLNFSHWSPSKPRNTLNPQQQVHGTVPELAEGSTQPAMSIQNGKESLAETIFSLIFCFLALLVINFIHPRPVPVRWYRASSQISEQLKAEAGWAGLGASTINPQSKGQHRQGVQVTQASSLVTSEITAHPGTGRILPAAPGKLLRGEDPPKRRPRSKEGTEGAPADPVWRHLSPGRQERHRILLLFTF